MQASSTNSSTATSNESRRVSIITILGAGVMGSAMSMPAADRGHEVRLVGTRLDRGIIDSVKASGRHPKLNMVLPAGDLHVTCQAGRNSRLGNSLGRGLTYSQIKSGLMLGDTIEGAGLGLAAAASLAGMMARGIPQPAATPLTRALIAALFNDQPLDIPWADLHQPG